jgi:chaperone protein EcpD
LNVALFGKKWLSLFFVLFGLSPFSIKAYASIVIDGTRVIYPVNKAEVSVRMTNEGGEPKLVQVWVDDGDSKARPETIHVPFAVMTPIFRLDPKKGQVARIQYTRNKTLPMDRESVFWLNVLEVPPKPSDVGQDESYLQFRFRTRIKLFLRPANLEGAASDAPDKLSFKYRHGFVEIKNPTPYYVSISSLWVGETGAGGNAISQMIAPRATQLVTLKEAAAALQAPLIKYQAIDDFGAAPVREKRALSF